MPEYAEDSKELQDARVVHGMRFYAQYRQAAREVVNEAVNKKGLSNRGLAVATNPNPAQPGAQAQQQLIIPRSGAQRPPLGGTRSNPRRVQPGSFQSAEPPRFRNRVSRPNFRPIPAHHSFP